MAWVCCSSRVVEATRRPRRGDGVRVVAIEAASRRCKRTVDVCTMRSSLPAGSEPGSCVGGLEASPRANSSALIVRGV